MTVLLIFALLCFLVAQLSFLTQPAKTMLCTVLACAGMLLWLLSCAGMVVLPACLR